MTEPDDPQDQQPSPDSEEPQHPSGAGRERWHGEAVREGQGLRALHADLAALRRELQSGLREAREELRVDFRNRFSELAGHVSEMLPRLGDLEDQVNELRGAGRGGDTETTPNPGASGAAGASDGQTDQGPPPTPAAGWDQMDRGTAEAAWAELARFVDEVLYWQYRLSRLQVPDCWPVHPRMVRELAWLRASYLEAREQEAEAGSASMGWHIRAVPGFLVNTADAVDPRECRPGIHRLTDPEVDTLRPALVEAHRTGQPLPPPSPETGPDRPRLRPEHFPTRQIGRESSAAAARSEGPPVPSVKSLPDVVVDACHRDYWLDYYREASAADLATRPD